MFDPSIVKFKEFIVSKTEHHQHHHHYYAAETTEAPTDDVLRRKFLQLLSESKHQCIARLAKQKLKESD
jgi:hypothetical protein